MYRTNVICRQYTLIIVDNPVLVYKLIALDLDDTLFNETGVVPDDVIETLSRLADKGVHIVISSGRSPLVGKYFAEKICKKYSVISHNGSMVQTEDGIERTSCIRPDVVKDIARYAHQNRLFIVTYNDNNILVESKAVDLSADIDSKFNEIIEIGDFTKADFKDVPKVVMLAEPARISVAMKEVREKYPDLFVTQSLPYVMEMTPKGIDKSYGLRVICDNLGIDKEEVVAIGDNYNDMPMLEWAGYPVAVANAVPAVKEIAKLVTKNEKSYGVKEAVETIFSDIL